MTGTATIEEPAVKIAADKVVILDRDGTIVVDRGYLADPAGLEFEPAAPEGLRWLHRRGYRLIVISNQSGVGRGYFTTERLAAMNERLRAMIETAGAKLDGIYCCPHAPDAGCECRKPGQALMLRAASELGFDPRAAYVVGDKDSDIEFGHRAGARTILIDPHATGAQYAHRADAVVPNLLAAARTVIAGPP
jgi:D-glycero-D-manno-heptose 1,7-bisphosphate phosphatase